MAPKHPQSFPKEDMEVGTLVVALMPGADVETAEDVDFYSAKVLRIVDDDNIVVMRFIHPIVEGNVEMTYVYSTYPSGREPLVERP